MKHEFARSPFSRHRKAWLLSTASALAMGATVLSPAWAVPLPVPETASVPEIGLTVTGYTTLLANPGNASTRLSATITNGLGGIVGSGTSASTAANSFTASAGGNDVTNTVTGTLLPLPVVAPTGIAGIDGVAVLGNSQNTAVVATALVANSNLVQQLASTVSAATVSGNTMTATTTLNQSATTVQGQVPLNYAADTTNYGGASSTANEGIPYDAVASVLATTAQFNTGSGQLAGSGAMVTENTIGQAITGPNDAAGVLNGSPAVTGNSMTAGFAGNSATTALMINAGGAPALNGSTALTNEQQNSADSGSGTNPASIVKYSYIQFELDRGSGTIGETEVPASVTLDGALAMTGNMITATATGNQAEGTSLSGSTGNVLTLGGGIGLQGTSNGDQESIQAVFVGGIPGIGVFGDAVVNNAQSNTTIPLDAMVKQSSVLALLPTVDGGSVALSSNTITAQTVGNEAYNALLAPGLGSPGTGSSLNGALAVGSQQSNQGSPLTATIFGPAGAAIGADGANNATLALNANTISASATGNSVINTINLNASNLASYSGFWAGTFAERNPSGPVTDNFAADADAILTSAQSNNAASPVVALNQNGGVNLVTGVNGGGVTGSTLSVTGNTTAALATGNAATNSLTLNGASVAASAALLGAQSSYGAVTATLTDPTTALSTGGAADPLNSTLALTGNLERAIATGNFATNTLSTTGSTIAVANGAGPASVFSYVPSLAFPIASDGEQDDQTAAGFVAHNDQATTAPVTAAVTFTTPSTVTFPTSGSMEIIVSDGLTSSTADNSINAIVAAARGNQATTQLTLSPSDTLDVGGEKEPAYSPFAVVANAQTVGNATNIQASINAGGVGAPPPEELSAPLPPIYTTVTGGMTGSTLTMTANQIMTLAQGNNATNGLTLANAGTVAQPGGSQPLGLLVAPVAESDPPNTAVTADAAFTVSNMQFAGTGTVSAPQNATGVQAAIAGNLSSSTVMVGGTTAALGNMISSTATTNLANNALTLAASNLSASSGLLNFQVSNGATSTTLGAPPAPTIEIVLADTSNHNNAGFAGGTFVDEETFQDYTGWLVSTDPNSMLDGFTQGTAANSGNYYKFVTNLMIPEEVSYGFQVSFNNTIPPTPSTWGSPALVITLNGNVANSTLGVAQNMVNAASTANAATNTVTSTSAISSSSLSYTYTEETVPASGFTGPGASYSATFGPSVLADVALLNNQTLGAGGGSAATANGSFGISNAAVAPVYTNATLSVSNNTQQASAVGNTATNILMLSPGVTPTVTVEEVTTSLPPQTASILSTQFANGGVETPVAVSATSTMQIGAPMAMTGSTLAISGNTNTASAVVNDVTNTMTVTGTSSLPGTGLAQNGVVTASIATLGIQAYGDYTVVNAQTVAGGSVQSTATTTLINNDLYLDPGAISGTSVSVDSNTTAAQSFGNRSGNTLTITAAGSSAATGAVANGQINGATIGATATVNTTLALGQASGVQTSPSTSTNATYGMTNNVTQAFATGNQANNTLNASPAAYGTAIALPGSNVNTSGGMQTNATYAVLNAQYNTGPVTAAVTGASPTLLTGITNGGGGYIMALNTTGAGNVVNVSGNTVTSQAIGNRASNNIVLAALNTGTASSSINSVQQNTGSISASISNVQVGAGVTTGTTARVGGNSLAASAFGNIATSSMVTH